MFIRVDTVDGTAEEGSDYRGIHEVYRMEPHQTELAIDVEIGNENKWGTISGLKCSNFSG